MKVIAILMLFAVAGFFVLATVKTGNAGILLVVVLFAALGVSLLRSGKPYQPTRRREHSHAFILFDGDCANQITVSYLDDVSAYNFRHEFDWWSSTKKFTRVGNGQWTVTFQYMGNGRNEAAFSDPTHIANMKRAEKEINAFLRDTINPEKDREK